MSTISRLISGSVSSWVRIVVMMLSQMALVPLYLSHWNVKTYGIWIAIQAFVNVLATLDNGHQTFLAYEFLKFGRLKPDKLQKYLWSGALIGVFLGLLQIVIIIVIILTGILAPLLGETHISDSAMIHTVGIVLLMQGVSWLFCGSVGGLLIRALAPFGYYPRFSWWGVLAAIVTSGAPAVAVIMGGNLFVTGAVLAIANIVFNIPQFIDIFYLLKKEKIAFVGPSIKLGFKNLLLSLALSGKSLLENARQQGVRVILTPMVGTAGLANFSTLRTGANVALQGLNTIVNPLEPELMRFLHKRDQERSEASFGTIWIVVVAFMAPAILIVQTFIGPIYTVWTRGQIPFNAGLFAILSLGVLVYAVSQPAIAIVVGNNLLKPQLLLSALSALIVIGGLFILIPYCGLLGAGIALLAAEVFSTTGYRIVAKKWLVDNGLIWPKHSSQIAVTSVWITAIGMFFLIKYPHFKWIIFAVTMFLLMWNCYRYWLALPQIATTSAKGFLKKLPLIGKLFKS